MLLQWRVEVVVNFRCWFQYTNPREKCIISKISSLNGTVKIIGDSDSLLKEKRYLIY